MSLFAKNIKFLRQGRNLKTAELLAAIGFNQSQWNNYENNRSKPKFDDLVKIAKYFGVSESDLIHADLTNTHLNNSEKDGEKQQKTHLNTHPNTHLKPHYPSNPPSKFATVNEPGLDTESGDIKDELIRTQKFTIDMLREALAAAQERLEAAKKGKK